MAATPYKGTVTLRGRQTKTPYSLPISGPDVAGQNVTFDKSSQTFWTPPEDVDLIDITLSAAGADTTRLDLYVGGADGNQSWRKAGLLQTIALPHLPAAVGIRAGNMIQFREAA